MKTGRILGMFLSAMLFASVVLAAEGPVLVKHKEVKESRLQAFIPGISGAPSKTVENKINETLAASVQKNIDNFKIAAGDKSLPEEKVKRNTFFSGYAVKYNKYNLLSIVTYGEEYTGGAHGTRWKDSWTVDLASGKIYTLPELFNPISNYKNVINEAITQQIKEREWDKDVKFPGIDDKTRFYITEEMLVIYYPLYDIAPYVVGMPEFYIPIRNLQDMFAAGLKIQPL